MDNSLRYLMEHKGSGNAPKNMLAVMREKYRQSVPQDIREGEQGLEAPMVSPEDLIGSGLFTKAAMLAKGLIPLAGVGMAKNVGKNSLADIIGGGAKNLNTELLNKYKTTGFLSADIIGGGAKNLNTELLNKYKTTGFLSADEMAQYEKNALKMEKKGQYTQLAENAKLNPDYADYVGKDQYDYHHGTQRLDRLLQGINPKRATSGPMPFGASENTMASSYAVGKKDTSLGLTDDGNVADYFQVAPKSLGYRGSSPYSVEQTWNHLPAEKRAEIMDKYRRIGYENVDEGSGKIVLHDEAGSSIAGQDHLDYLLKNNRGNPLGAMRELWHDSGALYDNEAELANIYKLSGYPHEILQDNAPWATANGVLLGKARITNPINTSNTELLQNELVPALKQAFKNDRSRTLPERAGVDPWDKRARYTPKDWVNTLEADLQKGDNSYVWTSIPDKVTEQLNKLGYNGIIDTGGKGGGDAYQVVIPFKPNQVRSKFAAFDPLRKDSSSLLAGVGAGALGVNALFPTTQEPTY